MQLLILNVGTSTETDSACTQMNYAYTKMNDTGHTTLANDGRGLATITITRSCGMHGGGVAGWRVMHIET